MTKSWIPLTTAVVLFGLLVLTTGRDKRALQNVVAARDSALVAADRESEENASLLTGGDTLPQVTLVSAHGDSIDLQALPAKDKYLYFGRADCPGCMILHPVLDAVPVTRRDSIVVIAIDPDSSVSPAAAAGADYVWKHRRGTRRHFVVHIPTLVVRAPGNAVLTAAHGSLMRVASLFDLFGVLRRSDVSEALAKAVAAAGKNARIDSVRSLH